MAAASDEWSVNANEALHISLVQPGSKALTVRHDFHPEFTYPIVGEAEQIFGYKDLDINLQFAAHDLRPHLHISYSKKFPAVGTTSALDLKKTLKPFLPPTAFESNFDSQILEDANATDWTPPGSFVKGYTRGREHFEIWAGSLLEVPMRSLVDNIQILILFFIEGGQFINLEDVDWTLDRWRVYLVYHKSSSPSVTNASPYTFIGYATTYRFYKFDAAKSRAATNVFTFPAIQKITPNKLSSRLRISQFLITPPYQQAGHGSALYQAIYAEVMSDQTIVEMTVEDPSEEFDKLRDMNDFDVLEPQFKAAGIQINDSPFASSERRRISRVPTATLLPLDKLQEIRSRNKMASRQFARMVEMYLLAQVPHSHRASGGASLTSLTVKGSRAKNADDRRYYWWRLLLKQRIMKKNKDLLQQVTPEERVPQIDDSARAQEDEYEGLLLTYGLRRSNEEERQGNGESAVRKRKVIESDDDDDDDESDGASEGSKRQRL
ncbi:uncharacterized protein A1O9_04836 [Exophiala aquamarina CBS 119918]|uniref:Histone acetyltransferase type B catalytic subunit n=1 Tax=Exophiala aquamarina CBS 119918 TaxID=1182545 RepID=A0A072PKX0_9EURO|nr:uncharacterized protein A1O9_04836 [Exophiala aquamarina CBS 119918]KEF59988.1 hypothetical protein A1O9_04836 [Exophiala aquamarina CBS 119918]